MNNNIKNAIYDFAEKQTNGGKFAYISLLVTFLVIFSFVLASVKINQNYNVLLNNSGFVRFYPENTKFYQDFNSPNRFWNIKKFRFLKNANGFSYGDIYTENGNSHYLIVAKFDKSDEVPYDSNNYFILRQGDYVFVSDNEIVLEDLQERLENRKYGLFERRNIRNSIKNLPKDRDEMIIITNPIYLNGIVDNKYSLVFNKLFSSCVFSVKNNQKTEITGSLNYKEGNEISAIIINKIFDIFAPKTMEIKYFKKDNLAFFIGIKNFDRLANIFCFINKNFRNRYTDTLNAIEEDFSLKLKDEFVDYLKGNAFFYLFKNKKELEPLVVLETKRDFTSQINKLSMFLPITSNNLKISERELKTGTVNVLSCKNYPKELNYMTKANLFLLGFQNSIEQYISDKDNGNFTSSDDIKIFINFKYSDISKVIHTRVYENADISLNFEDNLNFTITLMPKGN